MKDSETERTQTSGDGERFNSPKVSLEAEVPEALFEGMREFIRQHPHWDQYSVITSALAGFLFQNGSPDSSVKDQYLAGLFSKPS
jgi:hypothetical protein